jgi:hypothetical protein
MRAVAQQADRVLVLTSEASEEGVVVTLSTGEVTRPMSVHTPLRSGGWEKPAPADAERALELARFRDYRERTPSLVDTRGLT